MCQWVDRLPEVFDNNIVKFNVVKFWNKDLIIQLQINLSPIKFASAQPQVVSFFLSIIILIINIVLISFNPFQLISSSLNTFQYVSILSIVSTQIYPWEYVLILWDDVIMGAFNYYVSTLGVGGGEGVVKSKCWHADTLKGRGARVET